MTGIEFPSREVPTHQENPSDQKGKPEVERTEKTGLDSPVTIGKSVEPVNIA